MPLALIDLRRRIVRSIKRIPLVDAVNARIRGRLQERAAREGLRRYHIEAERRGISAPSGEDLRRSLATRLAPRLGGRPPSPMGGLHIFLAYAATNWETVLPRALAPFGRVTEFEWRSRGFDDRTPDWLARRDAMNRAMLDTFLDAHRHAPVDAVVGYLSGHNTAPSVLDAMAREGPAIFNFCWDDKLCFPGPRLGGRYASPAAIAHAVDLNLTNAPESVIKYAVHAGLAMFWPEAAHPEVHRPHDLPFEFDVSFVGGCYGRRPAFMRELARLGVRVACFGSGWPGGPLTDEEVVRLYSRSRVNLGFAGVGYSRRLMCLKGRDFEAPMSGGLYLTQANPELRLVYDVGREIVTYRGAADCARTIRALLRDPARAQSIREAGRTRALRDHTYEARWTQVFRLAGLLGRPL